MVSHGLDQKTSSTSLNIPVAAFQSLQTLRNIILLRVMVNAFPARHIYVETLIYGYQIPLTAIGILREGYPSAAPSLFLSKWLFSLS